MSSHLAGAEDIIQAQCADFLSLDLTAPEFAQVGVRGRRMWVSNPQPCLLSIVLPKFEELD